ncbi:50S ribosomal protein L3 [Candidatus Dependentiae bacterium]|nr:50S ribosomal protein L3 [Candidatus Dependentiae bacterium]
MLKAVLGTKVGMTQLFDENRRVVPVTAISTGSWFVTQVKKGSSDGYSAVQVGLPRERYRSLEFSPEWLKNKKKFFLFVREVSIASLNEQDYQVGRAVSLADIAISVGDLVDVQGTSIGRGFAGGIKRHGFAGGPASHGSCFHRIPGAVGHRRTHGEVDKGKRLPGHLGAEHVTVRNLKVVKVDVELGVIFVCGAVPGKSGFLVTVSKRG